MANLKSMFIKFVENNFGVKDTKKQTYVSKEDVCYYSIIRVANKKAKK